MKIIIAGGGAIGFHLAELLARENQDITLIDTDSEVLEQVSRHLDILTIQGDASSPSILEEAGVKYAQLFVSVTTSEKTNLLACLVAHDRGAKKTIARIQNLEYLKKENKKRFQKLGIDMMISPERMAAMEIERLLQRASFTDHFEFEDGKISIVGFTIDAKSPIINQSLEKVSQMAEDFTFRGMALLRGQTTIIPGSDTVLRQGDHLYLSTKNNSLEKVMIFAGKQLKPVKKVMIIGETPLALKTAKLIESKYNLTIVLKDEEIGKKFINDLKHALVINADPGDIDELKEEGLQHMDAFVALTPNSETNIIASLMAEDLGVYKTIALVENVNYTSISQNIGIDTIINKKLLAANNIFRFVRKGRVEAIASLHGVDAEIIEFEIHKNNRLLHHPIKELHFPDNSIIAGIIREDDSFVPDGDSYFKMGDKVIVFALPQAISQIEQIFK